jgi:hypothetical protein
MSGDIISLKVAASVGISILSGSSISPVLSRQDSRVET